MPAPQPLDSKVYEAQPSEQPVKPAAGRCDDLGCFPDLMGNEQHCIYCGETIS